MSNAKRQSVRHAPSPKKKGINWIWISIIGVVVVLGVGAIYLSGGGKEAGKSEIAESVTVSGEAVPQGTTLGAKAPTVTGTAPNGDEVTIAPGQGTPMIIFGVAHWCPHCQAEVPRLTSYDSEGMFDGVELVAISTAQDEARGNWPPSVWLKDENWDHTVLADDAEATAFNAYGMSGFPYILAIDAQGNVVARTSGEQSEAQMQAIVAAAKSGTKDTDTAAGDSSDS